MRCHSKRAELRVKLGVVLAIKEHLHFAGFIGRRNFHLSRWTKDFWTICVAFDVSTEKDQVATSSA